MSTTTAASSATPTRPGGGRRALLLILVILGSLIASSGLATVLGGSALAWVNAQQGAAGYLSTPTETLSVNTYAVTSPSLDLGNQQGLTVIAGDLGNIRLQATSTQTNVPLFLGIAPTADVERYLASAAHSEITSMEMYPFAARFRQLTGTEQPAPPGTQDFWAASTTGTGTQELVVALESGKEIPSGRWTVVIMNVDASQGVSADVSVGARVGFLGPLGVLLILGGILSLLVGIALILVGAIMLGREQERGGASASGADGQPMQNVAGPGNAGFVAGPAPTAGLPPASLYPSRVRGALDLNLSNWLWLFKWVLIVPHVIILFFLGFAFAVVTVIAWFAILFTARYPRVLFAFNVGVIRWGWRVAYYSYSALGTDRYPPFTLDKTDYPADFDVDYPERLSRGLIFVKSWLLAIPHLLIIAAFTGAATGGTWMPSWPMTGRIPTGVSAGASLLGLLVLVAAVILLFSGRYQQPLFDLILGLNRWVLRVLTYTGLFRDEYPPFRLDQGAEEPEPASVGTRSASGSPQ
ncbi:DUF4389 domain-containing protein [Cryobacterium psychrophilum]|uniref:DUF4389 domain-containing protein n=1 Tax=Cryobacterium psychrophilum TaxID=41988 RepID=A0A4Y8KRZ9_9MICO|nr:DUF4389 domain-containing protein [Cryobacterium psychrophilum]TDW29404.1 uncharacterized protein DUF4389 [Cryobacterium psychrophilum]TFD81453.1 DUF4389 domain-containing protein [Cryobacterium psychrophilum]